MRYVVGVSATTRQKTDELQETQFELLGGLAQNYVESKAKEEAQPKVKRSIA